PDRHGIEVVKLLPATLPRDDESRALEHAQVPHHAEAGHRHALAELSQGLAIASKQPVEHPPATSIRKSLEDRVITQTGHGSRRTPGHGRPLLSPARENPACHRRNNM